MKLDSRDAGIQGMETQPTYWVRKQKEGGFLRPLTRMSAAERKLSDQLYL